MLILPLFSWILLCFEVFKLSILFILFSKVWRFKFWGFKDFPSKLKLWENDASEDWLLEAELEGTGVSALKLVPRRVTLWLKAKPKK